MYSYNQACIHTCEAIVIVTKRNHKTTLDSHAFEKHYIFKTYNFHHRVLRVILHLEHLPLRHGTAVNIGGAINRVFAFFYLWP